MKNATTVIIYVLILMLALLRASTGQFDLLLFLLGLGGVAFLIGWISTLFENKKSQDFGVKKAKNGNYNKQNEDTYYEETGICKSCKGRGYYIACKNCGGTPAMFDDYDDNVNLVCLSCRKEGLDDENIDYVDCEDCKDLALFNKLQNKNGS